METRWEIKRSDSKLYAFFVAILPCVMMYKVPILEKGASTIIVLSCAVILLLNCHKVDIHDAKIIFPSFLYLVYVACRSKGDWIEIVLQISAFIHLYAICTNTMNTAACKKYIKNIAVLASICVTIQYLSSVVFHKHIPMIAYDFCLDELKGYANKAISGISSQLYRPSAFFLEPAHMAQYLMLGLALCLLDKQKDYRKALIISIGMVLTTSGMGVVILVCIWGWFYFSQIKNSDSSKMNIIIAGAAAALIVIMIAISIPEFQRILARIFGSFGDETSDYNAIRGRLFWWNTYISSLNGLDLVFGKGSALLPGVYLTGFMEIVFAYGIIGVFLYYNMLLYLLHKSKNACSSCIIVIIGGLMFFANLTGFIHSIIHIGVIIALIKEDSFIATEKELMVSRSNRCQYIQ